MRRADREVTNFGEILEIIGRCDVLRLALNGEGYPYILPLNFGEKVTDGRVEFYFHGAREGTKYAHMARDSRASFEMDCAHRLIADEERGQCTMEYESVIGRGHVEEVPEAEKETGLRILLAHYGKENFVYDRAALPATRVFKLVVESMTAKRRKCKKV